MAQEQAITIDQATLRSFHPKAARLNLDGDEIEGPKMILTFEVDVDRVDMSMTRLTRVFRKRKFITLGLNFPEQLELEDARKSTASNNGHQDVAGGELTEITPIGEGKRSKKGEKART